MITLNSDIYVYAWTAVASLGLSAIIVGAIQAVKYCKLISQVRKAAYMVAVLEHLELLDARQKVQDFFETELGIRVEFEDDEV